MRGKKQGKFSGFLVEKSWKVEMHKGREAAKKGKPKTAGKKAAIEYGKGKKKGYHFVSFENFLKIIDLDLKNVYIKGSGKVWRQEKGGPMGSPLMVACANAYGLAWEEKKGTKGFDLFNRYVDDILMVWEGRRKKPPGYGAKAYPGCELIIEPTILHKAKPGATFLYCGFHMVMWRGLILARNGVDKKNFHRKFHGANLRGAEWEAIQKTYEVSDGRNRTRI